jgi:hypothetical protein
VTEAFVQHVAQDEPVTISSLPVSPTTSRWAFINGSRVEPQADDRIPMFGAVAVSTRSPSAQRSTARRRHQAMYKEWSQNRHD